MSRSPPISELTADFLFSLEGKVAVVTGGSRGIGKEICRAYAAAGCDVIIASRKVENCKELAKQIQGECPGRRALPFAFNANKWSECQKLFEFAYNSCGKVDILVNNAGGSPLYPSMKDITEEYFDKVMGLNIKGPFRLAVLFASKMCEQEGGSIINITTEATIEPAPSAVVYGAAKSGLHYITQTLAKAYGPKVRVNSIMPGPTLTDISNAWELKQRQKEWKLRSALMRAGRADELVGAALYFASAASSFSTGSTLQVTGMTSDGARDPYHKKTLDYDRDVLPQMRDERLSKL